MTIGLKDMHPAVLAAPAGYLGFDCNTPVSRDDAGIFRRAGYQFAVRYAPRVKAAPHDLTTGEAIGILVAGLGLMVVQHVERETAGGWVPSAQKGADYGGTAAEHMRRCGILLGTMCWLDLENVARVPREIIISYCNNWYTAVARVGYTPGLYVGYDARLTPDELYRRLRFEHYWAAYNLNADQHPSVRGVQMKQHRETHIPGIAYPIDPDTVAHDHKGGAPLVMAPADWLEDRP